MRAGNRPSSRQTGWGKVQVGVCPSPDFSEDRGRTFYAAAAVFVLVRMGCEIFVLLLENENNLLFNNTGVGMGWDVSLFKGRKLTLASNLSFNLFWQISIQGAIRSLADGVSRPL